MKFLTKKILATGLALGLFMPLSVSADAQPGDRIITLGANLTEEQKNMLLSEMKATQNEEIITVTNDEEHKYLGSYISKRLIGTKAISSSSITLGKKASGLKVETKNINWVTNEMYVNALITAGVKDAEIYVTSPIPVSGTAALTGLIKAYELSSDKVIPEDVKQAANEEMVKTATLGDQIGTEEATALMTRIKEEMAKNPPETEEELKALIENAAKELGLTLNEAQIQSLIDLFNKLKELNIDWNQVGDQLNQAKEQLDAFLSSEEGQTFLEKLKEVFISLIDAIKALFK
ncbi:DUF1002 domain-containing protein [Peribacillus acanthi]|uniref:DUF1002 domain-containing protein n=1 Tax=Peribacillus acanthi TaxID=2171554 RepID=UPI000D3ED27A|nr:DUF1002 domain-containing protein [Peribacillus acanthi]